MNKPIPGCSWANERLLVGLCKGHVTKLPSALIADLCVAGVDCVLSLEQRPVPRRRGGCALWPTTRHGGHRFDIRPPRVSLAYAFWPENDAVPTARQVRQTLDEIDEAHAVGLRVFLHGAGIPSRAVMAAACWLARHECGMSTNGDPATARLGWFHDGHGSDRHAKRTFSLNDAQRAFVGDWPVGRNAEPVLGVTELLDESEPYPIATVGSWLRTLPTVRVYPEGRAGRCSEVPVIAEQRVSNGTINLELYDLHSGIWIGERTLRLLDGTVMVFISPFRKQGR